MRPSLAVALLVAAVVFQATPRCGAEQVIEPLSPPDEQRIEIISGGDETQRVEAVAGSPEQTVGAHLPPSPSQKAASKAGKFMLGVASAGVALGVMAASLLLL